MRGLLGLEIEARGGFMLPESSSPITAPGILPGGNAQGAPTGYLLYGTMTPYSYDPFAVAVAAGYRIRPFVSAGLFFDYGTFQINGGCDTATIQCNDGTSQLQRQVWQLGAYGRYYLTTLSARLQPWIELNVGVNEDTTSYTRILGAGGSNIPTTNYYLTYWGLVTNLRVGLDWRLSPWFAVGPFVEYSRAFPLSGEAQVCPQSATESGNCDTGSPYYRDTTSSPVVTSGYGMFYGGIFLKVTLGPSLR